MIKYIVKEGFKINFSILHLGAVPFVNACEKGHYKIAKYFLDMSLVNYYEKIEPEYYFRL